MNETTIDQVVTNQKTKRPVAITIISILGFIGSLFSILILILALSKGRVSTAYAIMLPLSSIIGIASMVGLWKMKKWGVYLYSVLILFNQIFLIYLGVWSAVSLIIPAIVLGVAYANINKMS